MPSTRCCIDGRRGPPAADVGRRGASPVATALTRFLRQCNRHCCHSVATAHRVVQQRSAGSCDDATGSVANPLPQRIAGCNSAQCDNAELLHESAVCCNGAPRVATAYDYVANRSTLHLLQRIATVQPVVMPVATQCNLLWRNRTCCKKRTAAVTHTSAICCSAVPCCNRPQPAATDHSPLQPAAVIATQRRQHAHCTARATVGPLSPSLHLSTRLVPVSTGNSTNKEGS